MYYYDFSLTDSALSLSGFSWNSILAGLTQVLQEVKLSASLMGCDTWSLGYVSDLLENTGFRMQTWHYVCFQVKSEGGLNASASFVAKANPLNRAPHKRKSELHHALCNMLSNILAPLSDGGKSQWPPSVAEPALTLWYEAVGRIRVQLIHWMEKQSKHLGVRQSDLISLSCFPCDFSP